jgi:hypothetical protein
MMIDEELSMQVGLRQKKVFGVFVPHHLRHGSVRVDPFACGRDLADADARVFKDRSVLLFAFAQGTGHFFFSAILLLSSSFARRKDWASEEISLPRERATRR